MGKLSSSLCRPGRRGRLRAQGISVSREQSWKEESWGEQPARTLGLAQSVWAGVPSSGLPTPEAETPMHKPLFPTLSLQEQIQKCLECLRREREEIQRIQSRENQRIQVLLVGRCPFPGPCPRGACGAERSL